MDRGGKQPQGVAADVRGEDSFHPQVLQGDLHRIIHGPVGTPGAEIRGTVRQGLPQNLLRNHRRRRLHGHPEKPADHLPHQTRLVLVEAGKEVRAFAPDGHREPPGLG